MNKRLMKTTIELNGWVFLFYVRRDGTLMLMGRVEALQ